MSVKETMNFSVHVLRTSRSCAKDQDDEAMWPFRRNVPCGESRTCPSTGNIYIIALSWCSQHHSRTATLHDEESPSVVATDGRRLATDKTQA